MLVLFPVNTPQGGRKPQTRGLSIADLRVKILTNADGILNKSFFSAMFYAGKSH